MLKKIYCAVAAVFFCACAYAQLNDPDPFLWILGYLTGGVVLNALIFFGDDSTASMIDVVVTTFAAGNAAVVASWAASLLPRIDYTIRPFKALLWSVLEFEEGREIAGLLILMLHVLRLRGFLQERRGFDSASRGDELHTVPQVTGWMGTLSLVGVISGAVYLWVYYQPEMNSRYQTEHCDGQFASTEDKLAGTEEL